MTIYTKTYPIAGDWGVVAEGVSRAIIKNQGDGPVLLCQCDKLDDLDLSSNGHRLESGEKIDFTSISSATKIAARRLLTVPALLAVTATLESGKASLPDGSIATQISSTQKKWSDDFGGLTLDEDHWEVELNAGGMTMSVSSSNLAVNMGVNANAELRLLSKEVFTVPFDVGVSFMMSQRINNNTVAFEAVEVDPETLLPIDNVNLAGDWANRASMVFDGTVATTSKLDTVGDSSNALLSTSATITTTGALLDALMELRPQDVVVTSVVSNNAAARSTAAHRNSTNIPDPNKLYKFRMRFKNGASAPASATTVTIARVLVADVQEIAVEVASGRGDQASGKGLAVNIANASLPGLGAGTQVIGAVGPFSESVVDIVSAAITATGTTSAVTPARAGGAAEFVIAVTAVSGTSPTLDVVVQESDDGGVNWYDIYHFPRITASGAYRSGAIPTNGNRFRYVQTIGGTSPSFTRALTRNHFPFLRPLGRKQFFDRAMVLATANSTTPSYYVEGCDTHEAIIFVGTWAANAVVRLEFSDDGSNWYNPLADVTITATGAWRFFVENVSSRFARLRVITAGAGTIQTFTTLKSWRG